MELKEIILSGIMALTVGCATTDIPIAPSIPVQEFSGIRLKEGLYNILAGYIGVACDTNYPDAANMAQRYIQEGIAKNNQSLGKQIDPERITFRGRDIIGIDGTEEKKCIGIYVNHQDYDLNQ